MPSKQNILIFGLMIIVPTVVGMLYDPAMLLFFSAQIPIFAALFLVLSFFIKSNKVIISISISIALAYPQLIHVSIILGSGLADGLG